MAFLHKRDQIWSIYWQLNGKKHGKSLRTKSKRVAEEYLKEFEYRLAKRELGQETDITLDQLRDQYLEYSKATKTIRSYERHDLPRVTRFVEYLKRRGLSKASQITQACVEDYQVSLLDLLAPRTVRHCMYAASGLLSFAVRRSYLSNNVVKNVAKVKVQANPPRFLSAEEWEKVKETAQKTYLWPLAATAYYTGFRNSELRFLTWEEIDFGRDVITLCNKPGFTLKNRQSRTVPLSRGLKGVLHPLRKQKGFCFTNESGEQFSRDSQLSRKFEQLVVTPSGLPHFSLHTLRHTFASHLVMQGISIYKVSQWLGHKSVNTTMIYAHLAPQDDEINALK